MAASTPVAIALLAASAGLFALNTAGDWRAMTRHLPAADPRVRRARRLGSAGGTCVVAAAALHWSAVGSDWPVAVFGVVIGLYVVGFALFAVAHTRFARLAPPDHWGGPPAP